MSARLIVTIDGPAGVGKTTMAKKTAGALGIAYLDTGASSAPLPCALAGASRTVEKRRFELARKNFPSASRVWGRRQRLCATARW